MPNMSYDRWLGLFFFVCALLLVVVWVPLDTGTGYIEKVRRQVTLGDALAPTFAGLLILFASVLLWFEGKAHQPHLTHANMVWLAKLIGLIACTLLIMRYAGPLATSLLADGDYRPLRATAPWKFIGYGLGGTALIFGLISLVERRLSWRWFALAAVATALIAAFYDLPFDDLILPPNGDV